MGQTKNMLILYSLRVYYSSLHKSTASDLEHLARCRMCLCGIASVFRLPLSIYHLSLESMKSMFTAGN